ncbi:transcriptional regulator containing PAS, AAA-type ATPase, and DNA-binding domains [Desulfosporosinus acidiphilus SJ4]|uniref:Transcriptional regulator containing PAS, AAA-type ATPase, and DNA-binding domains n=1 Tax=Desulfosporosinus acidiphilus (strain DSM 22704 / JCM 16185 / SJ4) TaxID=646529 RepID=I4D114_DESAJ|nr:sigma-54-dependent Fis family transcriptional regulator [Desulfosporosinus acidiphilus]AFM39488.1 transcriptional regulator containing PAS, AAA-type ATPase, and DNA-binding domains [Desulfosporosinus acidiphilus SJ4]
MDYSRILFVAPYEELAEEARKTVSFLEKPCRVIVADMSDGAAAAQKALNDGIEVIISRGGTASLIRQAVTIPVIEVEVTGYDILRALNPLREIDGTFGIIGFPSVIKGCQTVAEMLGLNYHICELGEGDEELLSVNTEEFAQTKVIVGDTIAVRYSEILNCPVHLIKSGPESIAAAIMQAEQLIEALEKERAKTALSTVILNAVHEGVVTIDKEGTIVNINAEAQKMLGLSSDILGKPAKGLFRSQLLAGPQVRKITGYPDIVNGKDLVINLYPILVREVHLGTVMTLQNTLEIQQAEYNIRRKLYHKGLIAKLSLDDFKGNCKSVRSALDQARKYAFTDSSILIQGESGTGKEIIAQGIHQVSLRQKGPFVAINCAALPENLLESELFGYEEGAFTGARKGGKQGLFELAHKGTLFLDEVGELPLHVQARLLRILQEKEVMRVGGDRIIPVDVRLISATHRNLNEAVEKNEFRADLFYRLNVLGLMVPPLRERKGDIRLLMDQFLSELAPKLGKTRLKYPEEVYQAFESYHWPGNVRELRNCVEKLIVLSETNLILPESLKAIPFITQNKIELANVSASSKPPEGSEETGEFHEEDNLVSIQGSLNDIEKRIIEKVVKLENHNLSRAAKRLGIDRSTLWRKRR